MEQFEPPKYIASLIAAINDGAKSAQLGALAFVAVGLFLLATTFAASDEDLLLNHSVAISQLGGVSVPVVFAFGLAPAVFLAAHVYTLMRFDMLAGNIRRFMEDLPTMVPLRMDQERCRQLLANVEFVQGMVTPRNAASASLAFRLVAWFIIEIFPVLVLLLVQIGSLRLQHSAVNWINHGCILGDLGILLWFLRRPWAIASTAAKARRWGLAGALLVGSADLAWLHVPSADDDTVRQPAAIYRWPWRNQIELPYWLAVTANLPRQPIDLWLCPELKWGCRFLSVTYRPLVAKVWDSKTFVEIRAGAILTDSRKAAIEGISLRNRVLRFADLTGSELYAADLTGAQLQRATLTDANLERSILREAKLSGARMNDAQLRGADMESAELQGASLVGARLHGAWLLGAQLQGADLKNAQLQGADLSGAALQGADLSFAQLQGVNVRDAHLEGADMKGAQWLGADLRGAHLWNAIGDLQTVFSLNDMRDLDFVKVPPPGLPDTLPAGTPNRARKQVQLALTPVEERGWFRDFVLPGSATIAGPILVSDTTTSPWRSVSPWQLTTDGARIDPPLAEYLADQVATIAPAAAQNVALRVLGQALDDPARPLVKLLGCRLQAHAASGKVVLRSDTLEYLSKATGSCDISVP